MESLALITFENSFNTFRLGSYTGFLTETNWNKSSENAMLQVSLA
jgi:hypothetical protein